MGNWERQQEEKRDIRERERVSKETLGKFFYDLSKLSFAALVIGSVASVVINKDNIDSYLLDKEKMYAENNQKLANLEKKTDKLPCGKHGESIGTLAHKNIALCV